MSEFYCKLTSLYRLLFLVLACCLFSQAARTQTWDDFKGLELKLIRYGGFQNGKELNSFEAKNEFLAFDTNNDGRIVWSGKLDGTQIFTYSINDKTLTLKNVNSNSNQPSWIKIDGGGYSYIHTYDNLGTYRYFKVVSESDMFQNMIKKASDNNPDAMINVGWFKEIGLGCERDYKEAYSWYKRAADLGNENAQLKLGEFYFNGFGVKKNYDEAKSIFEDLVSKGALVDFAQYFLEKIYYFGGYGVQKDWNKVKAILENLISKGGDVKSEYFELGLIYYHGGYGVQKDYKKAIEMYEKSAAQGFAFAQTNLGFCYEKGTGVEKNYLKALELWEKAAKQGAKYAIGNIGELYYYGRGVSKNYIKAIEYFNKSLEGEDTPPNSMYLLSKCYRFGRGVGKDMEKAEYWLKKAMECGDEDALKLQTLMNKL